MGRFHLCVLPFLPLCVVAEHADERIGCTAIAIDGAASVDGSAFAGMNADSANADNRLTYVPAAKYAKGSMRPVFTFDLAYPRFVGFGRGEFYHPHAGQTLRVPVGHMPEVESTFGYYESTEPLMNDQGLGLGESSCAGMLSNKFVGDNADKRDVPTGMLDTVTLMQLALERCATSRCAVETMGALSEAHGFVPTPGEAVVGNVGKRVAYDDAGEAYTVADKTGEAWVFHVIGGVQGITKSIWVAQKVAKGHFAVVANEFTIGELPSQPNDDFLFNKETFRAAIAAKLWDGKGALHWSRTFAPAPTVFESPTGQTPIPLYGALRRWGLMNLVAPSLKPQFHMSGLDYPFSWKVDKKMSHRDVMSCFKYHYQGTEFDMTQGLLAGPFSTPFRIEGNSYASGQIPRGISILRTLYGIIVETGPKRSRAWYASDAPLTSVYVPLYAESSAVSAPYRTGNNAEFTRDSASWAFNFVNNYMQLNYRDSSQQDVYPAIEKLQDAIDAESISVEQEGSVALSKWQRSVQEHVVASWWKLADFLVVKYNDGRLNSPTLGSAIGYPQGYIDMIGFSADVHPVWVQPATKPPSSVTGYVSPKFPLPLDWDGKSQVWSNDGGVVSPTQSTTQLSASTTQVLVVPMSLLLAVATGLIGVVLGRSYERSRQKEHDAYLRLS